MNHDIVLTTGIYYLIKDSIRRKKASTFATKSKFKLKKVGFNRFWSSLYLKFGFFCDSHFLLAHRMCKG